jgi:hypothetical protein
MLLPITPEVEVARAGDCLISVSRSHDGFCISQTRSDGRRGITAGRLPQPADRLQNVVAIVTTQQGTVSLVTGLVMPDVARVQVHFRNSTTISARTKAVPDALKTELRTFVIEARFDDQPLGPGSPPLVLRYVLFGSEDAVLERLEPPRGTERS